MYLLLTYIVYYILCLLYALRFEHLHWVDIAHYKNSLLLLLFKYSNLILIMIYSEISFGFLVAHTEKEKF